MLPAVEVDPASSDFRYQVNRPRQTQLGIEGLRINRLMTWHSIRMELVAVTGGGRPYRSLPSFAVHTELDISTSQDFTGPLSQESLPDLLREFEDYVLELLRDGDRP
jgi:hypothetical protein